MTIEFRCTNCDKLLRTPEGTSGKKAKCPECGTIVNIPEASAAAAPPPLQVPPTAQQPQPARSPFEMPPAPPRLDPSSSNPYQTPQASSELPGVAPGTYTPTRIAVGETLGRAWEIYKANLGACIGATLVVLILSMIVGAVTSALFIPVMFAVQDPMIRQAASLVNQLVSQVVGVFFWMGLISYMLRVCRGYPAEYGALFSSGPLFLKGAAVQLLTGLATILPVVPAGFAAAADAPPAIVAGLFMVGGGIVVVVSLMLYQAMYILVDQRTGILQSINMSIEVMRGNKLAVFGIFLVGGLLAMVVTVFTCGLGLIVAMPFMVVLATVIYLGVTGQPTMLDRPSQLAEPGFGAATI